MRTAVLAASLAAAALLAPRAAEAAPNVNRRGFQVEGMFGVAGCIPGKAECKASEINPGKTGPSFGMGFTAGFRPVRPLLIGAAYNLGFFNPDYRDGSSDLYKSAYQNSVFGVIRGIIPIWRLDLGFELAPGWSRQTFKVRGDLDGLYAKEFSQGFALKTGPSIDFYVTRRMFLGAKIDLIFNFHRQVCRDFAGGNRVCEAKSDEFRASVHQVIAGFHIGGTF
jgi:hypothetical protein